MVTPVAGRPDSAGPTLGRYVELVGSTLVASGALTAILYYFGYVRERALFSYFGIPLGSLEFTTSDYVLRSGQAVFGPLTALLLLAALALLLHQLVIARSDERPPRWWRLGWIATGGLAVALLVIGATGAYFHSLVAGPTASAIALGAGAVLLDYSAWMATGDTRIPAAVPKALRATRLPRRLTLLGVALIATFWWTLNVAHQNGLQSAIAIESSLEIRNEAVVLSDVRLGIVGRGVHVETLSPQGSGYAFRYTGLRVLLHTGDRWVLVPRGWTHRNGDSVVLLPDEAEGLRVDVRP